MLTLTCRQSQSSLSISTTIFHSNVHHSVYCTSSIIQYHQLNPYVHACMCASLLACVDTFCLCKPVWQTRNERGGTEKLNGEGAQRLYFIANLTIHSVQKNPNKQQITTTTTKQSTIRFFPAMCEKQTCTSPGPVCAETPCCKSVPLIRAFSFLY